MLKCVDTEGGRGGSATMHGTRTRRLYRATHVQLRDIYSECTKYTQYSCMRSRPRICVCVCARNVDRVRDRACACTDALHNIFAIVKCKVPRGRGGVPLSQLFPASRSLAYSPHTVPQNGCAKAERTKEEAKGTEGKERARRYKGERDSRERETPRKQVFVFSCKSRAT